MSQKKVPLRQIHKKEAKMYKNEFKDVMFFFAKQDKIFLKKFITTQKKISLAFMWYVYRSCYFYFSEID